MTDPSNMADVKGLSQLYPGKGLGWMNLGSSVHAVLSRLKSQPLSYNQIGLIYSMEDPVLEPVIVELPENGIRLRFDGPDQRLRLIEIVDWSQSTFTYKNVEVVRRPAQSDKDNKIASLTPREPISGPSFRHIYNRLIGPAYAGEYQAPSSQKGYGTYVLSYPGLAVRFPLKHSSYSDKADFVSLLSSAASPATSMAIFAGPSWPEARENLYTSPPAFPRSLALSSKNSDTVPEEIEQVIVHGGGRIEMIRRSSNFDILLSETTPQELVAELGPPDAIYKKPSSRISIHAASRQGDTSPSFHPSSIGTDRSSNTSIPSGLEEDSDPEGKDNPSDTEDDSRPDSFYNYFHHGFDILISYPTTKSPPFPNAPIPSPSDPTAIQTQHNFESKLTATKIFLHGNIPGSYSFNRHRRSRWTISLPSPSSPVQPSKQTPPVHPLNSEMRYPQISTALSELFNTTTQQGMVLNRGWSNDLSSPESSVELLGGTMTLDDRARSPRTPMTGNESSVVIPGTTATATATAAATTTSGGGNTQLFGFPGLLFEVLADGNVSCLGVY